MAVYIHIPFCIRKKCPYCDFYSIPYKSGVEEKRYVAALLRELELRRGEIDTLETIFIGGGTPSCFDAGSIARIIEFINNNFSIADGAEITLEANPSSVDAEKLRALRHAGINRISLGVQSFDDAELKSLGRLHDPKSAIEALYIIKNYFENFSLDLIYALEGQTVGGWIRNVETALSFAPPHVSAYELTPEVGTPFGARLQSGEASLPAEDDIAMMYNLADELFGSAGLQAYEISNFAVDGFQCQHNQNYWRRGLYMGIGAGAHSHIHADGQRFSVRTSNAADLTQYLSAIEDGTLPVDEMTVIDGSERLKEDIFLGLRTSDGISRDKLAEAGVEMQTLNALVENGLAELNETSFRLTREKGFLVSNRIIGLIIDKISYSPNRVWNV